MKQCFVELCATYPFAAVANTKVYGYAYRSTVVNKLRSGLWLLSLFLSLSLSESPG